MHIRDVLSGAVHVLVSLAAVTVLPVAWYYPIFRVLIARGLLFDV
jgi:hypothetical protein